MSEPGFRGRSLIAGGELKTIIAGGGIGKNFTSVFPHDGNDHTLTFMIDGPSKTLYTFSDGVFVGPAVDASNITGSTISPLDFQFGGDGDIANPSTYAAKWKNSHYLVLDSALPSNINQIAQLLHGRGNIPLSKVEVGSLMGNISPQIITKRVSLSLANCSIKRSWKWSLS